jgi:predicted amidohydrolase
MRAAAIQLEPAIADVAANLDASERLANEAAAAGAEWIALPEFFTTGIAFDERLADAAVAPDGAATQMLRDVARRHGVTIGGSFLCRDSDGHTRNAYLLVGPGGSILGRHDKDLPTMWENAFYVGGEDDGVIEAGDLCVGTAVCWELMRTQTVRRLRGRVDLVMAGSGWWSIPQWPLTGPLEKSNARTATTIAEKLAPLVGAPVVHGANIGAIECPLPWMPANYRGYLEGGAVIAGANGEVVARRDRTEGPGFVIADVTPGRVDPSANPPGRFWLHRRGVVAAFTWNLQRIHGRRWYKRHTQGRPPLVVERASDSRTPA